jgi:uncharacterized membrane protein YhaH (DUF805 family)
MSNPFSGAIASMTNTNRRANRAEYIVGSFLIIPIGMFAALMVASLLGVALGQGFATFLTFVIFAAAVVAGIILNKNRFNDFDASGWWQLVPFASIAAMFIAGTDGVNGWGGRK